MAIKTIGVDHEISREVKREVDGKIVEDTYYLTNFVVDEADDITAMNAEGSDYLNYPAGSVAICTGNNGKAYMMNASETEYVEV